MTRKLIDCPKYKLNNKDEVIKIKESDFENCGQHTLSSKKWKEMRERIIINQF